MSGADSTGEGFDLGDELGKIDREQRPDDADEFAEKLSAYMDAKYKKSGSRKADIKTLVLTKFYPRPFTERILEDRDFIYGGNKDYLYHCDPQNNLWRTDGEDFIRFYFRTTTDCIEDALKKSHVIKEIIEDVQGFTYKPDGLPEPDVNLIPCLNGVYDLATNDFRPFRKDDYFTWTLPWNYNETAHCVYLKKLLNDTLPDPSFLWDLMAYCLYRGYPLQKFFMLIGRGRNGKGVYQTILSRLLGSTNVSNISLSDFEDNRFSASALYRCLANISSEENYGDLQNTRVLKMLTGGDQVQADRKFKRAVKFVNYAKIIISTNQVAQTRDTTDAFFRRVALQEFPHQFEIDPAIDIKIREDSPEMTLEFEGLLFLALQRLKTLKANNFIFARAHDFDSTRTRYLSLSNPLSQFLDETVDRTYKQENYIFKFEFLDKLNIWLRDHGFNEYPNNRLGREMKELGFEDARKDFNLEKRFLAWVGLHWKPIFTENVRDVRDNRVLYNCSLESIESVVKYPANPANPDTDFDTPPTLDGE